MKITYTKKLHDPRMYSEQGYWFSTNHGVQPGSIPHDVEIMDIKEAPGGKTFVKFDRFLTTKELNYYDMKEEAPSDDILSATDMEKKLEELKKAQKAYDKKAEKNDKQFSKMNKIANKLAGKFGADMSNAFASDNIQVAGTEEIYGNDVPTFEEYLDIQYGEDHPEDLETNDDIYTEYLNWIAAGHVYADDEISDDTDEFIDDAPQEFSSKETAVNWKYGKLPAIFKLVPEWVPGGINLDYGGGTVESGEIAQAYLDQYDVKEVLYDKYNLDDTQKRQAIAEVRRNGGADTCTMSNVLNVIKEESARLSALEYIKKLMKPSGTVYITVYEGSGESRQTGHDQYQNSRKTSTYLEEIQQVFPDAVRKGKLIIAHPGDVSACTTINSSSNGADEGGKILDAVEKATRKWMMNVMGYSRADAFTYSIIEVTKTDDETWHVEVRAELDYDDMVTLSEYLDTVIAEFDKDAYFDMVDSGIIEAVVTPGQITSCQAVEAANYDTWNDAMLARYEAREDNYDEPISVDPFDDYLEVYLDTYVDVDSEGDWEYEDESWADSNNGQDAFYSETVPGLVLTDGGTLLDDVTAVLQTVIPFDAGRYHVEGSLELTYTVYGVTEDLDTGNYNYNFAKAEFDISQSPADNIKVTKVYS